MVPAIAPEAESRLILTPPRNLIMLSVAVDQPSSSACPRISGRGAVDRIGVPGFATLRSASPKQAS